MPNPDHYYHPIANLAQELPDVLEFDNWVGVAAYIGLLENL